MSDLPIDMRRLRPLGRVVAWYRGRAGRAPGLRRHLITIVLVALLPAFTAAGLGIADAVSAYRTAYTGRLADAARALALAIDAELGGTLATLRAFAASPAFGQGDGTVDLAAAHRHALGVEAATGLGIALGDAEGRLLLHPRVAPGAPLPELGPPARAAILRAMAEERPVAAGLLPEPVTGQPVVALILPVPRRDGRPPGLAAEGSLDPARFDSLLAARGPARGGFAALVDQGGMVVARSDGLLRGRVLPPEVVARRHAAPEGVYHRVGLEGQRMLFAFASLRAAPGWTVTVAAPYAAYQESWTRPLLGTLGGGALALALAGALALRLGRRLLYPVERLAAHARAIAREPAALRNSAAGLPPAPVAELEALRQGFAAAEEAVAARRASERAACAALAESEARLRLALEGTGLGLWEQDLDRRLLRLDGQAARLAGGQLPAGTWLPLDGPEFTAWLAAIDPDDRPRRAAGRAAACASGAGLTTLEYRVLLGGAWRWLSFHSTVAQGEDGCRALSVVRDVTEARMAEQALARSEALFRASFDQAAVGIAHVGLDGAWLAVNERLCRILGRSREELLGLTFQQVTHPADLDLDMSQLRALLDGAIETYSIEKRYLRGDGGVAWARLTVSLLRDAAGHPERFVSIIEDISTEKAAEVALAESEARYRTLFERMEEGFALWEAIRGPEGRIVDFRLLERNAAVDRITGGALPEAAVGRTMRALFPALAPHWLAAYVRAATTGEPQAVEAEARSLGRWLSKRIYVPAPGRVAVLVRDVSDRVRGEQALRDSEAHLRRVLDTISAYVGVLAPDGTVLDANRALLKTAGITIEALRGHPLWEACWWSQDAALAARVRDACARAVAGEPSRFDAEVQMAGDSRAMIDFQIAPLRDAAGQVTHLIPSAVDITERRRSEEAKLLLAREVDHRAKNALAVVQSVLALTRTEDPSAFRRAVTGRIAALARAHTLLARERWQAAELRTLLAEELAAYRGSGDGAAVMLEGPRVGLAPEAAQPVAMVIHELATNAAKYGALSAPGGRVAVSWAREPGTEALALTWREMGGPPVAGPPARRGFGTSVVETTVRRQLQGRLALRWEPGGLRCEIVLPARLAVWPAEVALAQGAGG